MRGQAVGRKWMPPRRGSRMKARSLVLLLALGGAVSPAHEPRAGAAPPTVAGEDRFEAEVRPVLVQTCFPCHGGKKTSAGLRVDSREALLKGGDGGPAIEPGHP